MARSGAVARSGATDVDAAVAAARGAFRDWGGISGVERGRLLFRMAPGGPVPTGCDFRAYTLREPLGVCAEVVPWNGPLQICAHSCAAGEHRCPEVR